MDAQFVNYEDQHTSTPQYAQIAENSNSKSFVDDFENSEYLSPEQLQQESWIQRIRRRLARKRSNRKRQAEETAIAKSLENDFENSKHQSFNQPQTESWIQRIRRRFYRQKPADISADMDAQKSFESSEDSTFPQEPLTDDTETSDSSSLSTLNTTNDSDSFADDYSNADTYSTESPTSEMYEQQPDQDSLGQSSSFELSRPRQSTLVRSSDEFEQTLKIYAQQISSGEYNVTAMPCALIDLYKHNMTYLNNPWYAQVIENLLRDWVSQVAHIGRKAFRKCHWDAALTSDFMNFLNTIDRFLSEAANIDGLSKSQAFQDLVTIVNARFIDWFRLLMQTPGVNLERFSSTVHEYWGRFHSIPMKQLMIQVANLSVNDDSRIY